MLCVVAQFVFLLHPRVMWSRKTISLFPDFCITQSTNISLHCPTMFWVIGRQLCNVPLWSKELNFHTLGMWASPWLVKVKDCFMQTHIIENDVFVCLGRHLHWAYDLPLPILIWHIPNVDSEWGRHKWRASSPACYCLHLKVCSISKPRIKGSVATLACGWVGCIWSFYKILSVKVRYASVMQVLLLNGPMDLIDMWFGEDQRANLIKTHV